MKDQTEFIGKKCKKRGKMFERVNGNAISFGTVDRPEKLFATSYYSAVGYR